MLAPVLHCIDCRYPPPTGPDRGSGSKLSPGLRDWGSFARRVFFQCSTMAPTTAREEHRLKLGMGKDGKDLAFPMWDGRIRTPRPFSKQFAREAETAGVPQVTFMASGIPTSRICCAAAFLCMSCRPAPATPIRPVTLNIHAHLLPGQQEGAAAVVDAALNAALQE